MKNIIANKFIANIVKIISDHRKQYPNNSSLIIKDGICKGLKNILQIDTTDNKCTKLIKELDSIENKYFINSNEEKWQLSVFNDGNKLTIIISEYDSPVPV